MHQGNKDSLVVLQEILHMVEAVVAVVKVQNLHMILLADLLMQVLVTLQSLMV